MFTQPRLCVQFLSREMQVGEGGRAGPGSWNEHTSEKCLLREVSAQEEWCCELPNKDKQKMARFAEGRWTTARTRHIHVTGEKIATIKSINRLD